MKKKHLFLAFLLSIICLSSALTISTPVYAEEVPNTNETTESESLTQNSSATLQTTVNQNESNEFNTVISVFGEAKQEVAPDKAQIYVSIENVGKDESSLKKDTFEIYNNAISTLNKNGILSENIKLTNFYINSNCARFGSSAYFAVLDFCVKVDDLTNFNDIISNIENVENLKIKSLNFEVSNSNEAYKTVISKAIDNAIDKAKSILNKDNFEIISITEENNYCYSQLYKNYVDSEQSGTLIDNIEISAKVKVRLK